MSGGGSKQTDAVWTAAAEAAAGGGQAVVVTLTAARGSIPGEVGAKALISPSGIQVGTLGGGKVEAAVIRSVNESFEDPESRVWSTTWNLQQDLGMTCGGEVSFLFEKVGSSPRWHVVILGAGHVAQALVPVLATMACRVDVVDPRPEWLAKLPPHVGVRVHLEDYRVGATRVVESDSQVICVTQGHATDLPVVEWLLTDGPQVPFLGVIGSEVKRVKLAGELRQRGIPDERLSRVRCPVGLPIGGNHPAEIAISIAAQLLQERP